MVASIEAVEKSVRERHCFPHRSPGFGGHAALFAVCIVQPSTQCTLAAVDLQALACAQLGKAARAA